MFAVIFVSNDYDHIEGCECIFSSNTELDSDNYLIELRRKHDVSWTNYCKYCDEYVSKIDIPEYISEQSWRKIIVDKYGLSTSHIRLDNFHLQLSTLFKQGVIRSDNGFTPPKVTRSPHNLFVVEIEGSNVD